MESKAELVLHPVRLRIIQALLGRRLTPREIALLLPDVPPATLYRQLGRLVRGGVVSVVGESRVRGAIERTYAVSLEQAAIGEEEIQSLSRDDHMRLFMAFIAAVVGGFERYLAQDQLDFVKDGVSYSQATLYLDDDELRQFKAESAAVAMRAMALQPRPGRRPRVVSSIVVPGPGVTHDVADVPAGKGDEE
jgi:DNA-binding transcriptional ArsR family regulator